MLTLIFRNAAPGAAAKGPLSCFRIDGELVKDERGGRLARHADHAWEVDGARFLRLDCEDANTLQFEGRHGASPRYGPFAHFSSTDGVCYADQEVFAHYDAQTRLWFSHRNREYWWCAPLPERVAASPHRHRACAGARMALPRTDDCPPTPPFHAGLQTLLLHEACETAGGLGPLAQLLRVPAEVLSRWLEGEERPPEEIYRACADIVLLH